jgi:hypothetical protein
MVAGILGVGHSTHHTKQMNPCLFGVWLLFDACILGAYCFWFWIQPDCLKWMYMQAILLYIWSVLLVVYLHCQTRLAFWQLVTIYKACSLITVTLIGSCMVIVAWLVYDFDWTTKLLVFSFGFSRLILAVMIYPQTQTINMV